LTGTYISELLSNYLEKLLIGLILSKNFLKFDYVYVAPGDYMILGRTTSWISLIIYVERNLFFLIDCPYVVACLGVLLDGVY